MKKTCESLLLLAIFLLAGCSPMAPAVPVAKATSTRMPSIPPTRQPSATPEYIKTQCLDLLPTLPTDFDFHEGIVFLGFEKPAYISDLRKGTLRTLVAKYTEFASTSPDGKWLAYGFPSASGQRPPSLLVIESVDGKQQIKLPWDKRWYAGNPSWLDNEHIMLDVLFEPDRVPPEIPSAVVINPFSGEQRYLVSNYPFIAPLEGYPPQFAFDSSTVVYNPTLTLALYARQTQGNTQSLTGNIKTEAAVLWDMQAKNAIATLPGLVVKNQAFWSPMEAKFLLPLAQWISNGNMIENWFSVDKDGHAQPLTHFENIYTHASIYSSSLSPDGEAIAFWLYDYEQTNRELMILNVKTHELTKYCFQLPASDWWGIQNWSLDGHFLMLTADNPDRNETNNEVAHISYLINLQQNWIVQIDKSDDIPIGFVAEP